MLGWVLLVLAATLAPVAVALPMAGQSAAQSAAQPTISDTFACNGANTVGSIEGAGLPAGVALDSAVLQGGVVLARDASATASAADGTYRSAILSFAARGSYDIQITRANTNDVLVSASRTSFCAPPEATAAAHRNCATGTVTGAVVARYLPRNTWWQLGYNGKSGYDVLGGGPGAGPSTNDFPFTTNDVPTGATTMVMRLVDADVNHRYPPVAVTAALNGCTTPASPANHATSASHTPTSSTSATTTSASSPATTTAATSAAATAAAVALPGPSDGSTQTGEPGTRAAAVAHTSRLGTWAALVIAAIVIGVAILCVACWYIYQAQHPRRAL